MGYPTVIKQGQIKAIKPPKGTNVWDAYFNYVPFPTIREDNGHQVVTRIKTRSRKMLCKDYGYLPSGPHKLDKMKVDRVILKPDENIIYVM